eukprot:767444-Hanusia_phi.AAC.12
MSVGLRTPFDAFLEKKALAEEERRAERRHLHAIQHEIRKQKDHHISHQLEQCSRVVQSRILSAGDHVTSSGAALTKKIDNKLERYRQMTMNRIGSLPDSMFMKPVHGDSAGSNPSDMIVLKHFGGSSQKKYVPENAEELRAATMAKRQMIQNRKVQSDKLIRLVKSNEPILDCIDAGGDPYTAIKMMHMIETSVDEVDKNGRTSLSRYLDQEPITSSKIQVLIEANADVNTADREGRTCLMKAVIEAEVEMIEYFSSRGATVDQVDQAGNTPLMEAGSLRAGGL